MVKMTKRLCGQRMTGIQVEASRRRRWTRKLDGLHTARYMRDRRQSCSSQSQMLVHAQPKERAAHGLPSIVMDDYLLNNSFALLLRVWTRVPILFQLFFCQHILLQVLIEGFT